MTAKPKDSRPGSEALDSARGTSSILEAPRDRAGESPFGKARPDGNPARGRVDAEGGPAGDGRAARRPPRDRAGGRVLCRDLSLRRNLLPLRRRNERTPRCDRGG